MKYTKGYASHNEFKKYMKSLIKTNNTNILVHEVNTTISELSEIKFNASIEAIDIAIDNNVKLWSI